MRVSRWVSEIAGTHLFADVEEMLAAHVVEVLATGQREHLAFDLEDGAAILGLD
jgi:hypothetical protein